MVKNRFILFFFLCVIFSCNTGSAKVMHAILVADTGGSMGAITKPDIVRMQSELRTVAKHTEMILKEKIFIDQDFKQHKVTAYLSDLKVEASDVVVFYFSGHGYRTAQTKTKWPLISFELFRQGIDLKTIADEVRKKKPRFTLVMADCCNNFAEQYYNPMTRQIRINLPDPIPNYTGYTRLFKQAKGCVIVSSSSAGEFSYGCRYGGLYTHCFLVSLKQEIAQTTPSWAKVLKRASRFICNVQRPAYQIFTN